MFKRVNYDLDCTIGLFVADIEEVGVQLENFEILFVDVQNPNGVL